MCITDTSDATLLGENIQKKEIKYNYNAGYIGYQLREGYVSKSNMHDLLYAVLEFFKSFIDRILQAAEFKWLSWL